MQTPSKSVQSCPRSIQRLVRTLSRVSEEVGMVCVVYIVLLYYRILEPKWPSSKKARLRSMRKTTENNGSHASKKVSDVLLKPV